MSHRTLVGDQHYLAKTDTGLPIPAAPEFDSLEEECSDRKRRLAAAVRIFGKYGFGEGISGHLSVRDPSDPNLFWVNPFGISFKHVRVADLLCVDEEGNVVHGDGSVNPSAFVIHSMIHALCPGADAAAHAHSVHSRALGALGELLTPLDQESAAFYERQVLYNDYEHPSISLEQGKDIATKLGTNHAMLLRFHGVITVGQTLDQAIHRFMTYDSCAQVQLMARAAGNVSPMTPQQARAAQEGFGDAELARFSFQLLYDEITREQPDLLTE